MAISIVGSIGTIADSGTVTGTYTFSNGANRVLVVGAGAHQVNVSSVALNGTNLTQVVQGTTQFNEQINLWFYNSPPAGAAGTIKVVGANSGLGFIGAEFTGVKQTSEPAGSTSVNLASGVTANGTLTTSTANNVVVGGFYSEATWSSENGVGQVGIKHQNAQSFEAMALSYLPQTVAGAGTLSWNLSSGQRWATALLSLEPALGAGTNLSFKSLLGVGNI